MRMSLDDWLLLVLLSVLWGGAFFFAAIAVRELPPLTVVALRTSIAGLALGLLLKVRGEPWPSARGAIPAFIGMGILNNLVPFSLIFWAQTVIPSGLASILNATTPIFASIVAHALLADERMAPNRAAGVVIGFLGVVVLLGGSVAASAGMATLGMLACLAAALSYGMAGVFGRRFKSMGLGATPVAFGQLAATSLMMLPIIEVVDRPWTLPPPSAAAIVAVLALALVSTALAYVIFFRLLASAGAVNVTLVTLLIPVSAVLLGTLILGEQLALRHGLGMMLIGAGLLAIDGRLLDRWRAG